MTPRRLDSRVPERQPLRCASCGYRAVALGGWDAATAARLAGIPKRTVQDWRTMGHYRPERAWPPMQFDTTAYTLMDVIALKTLRVLLARRVRRDHACAIARRLARHDSAALCSVRLSGLPVWLLTLADAATYRQLARDCREAGRPDPLVTLRADPPRDDERALEDDGAIWLDLSTLIDDAAANANAWLVEHGYHDPPSWL